MKALSSTLHGLALLVLAAAPVHAAEFYLQAKEFTLALPDGSSVPMWGFASCAAGFSTCGDASAPGPVLRVPDSEPAPVTVTIHLQNQLPEAVSLVMPAQLAPLHPVKFDDGTGRMRMRSMTTEAAPGATADYTWTNFREGTSLYQSGSHPQVQVPMGLAGVIIRDVVPGSAYASVPYDVEALLTLSEVDVGLHQAVKDGVFGTPVYPSAIRALPTWFLVNGAPYTAGQAPVPAGKAGGRVLVRMVNAGIQHRAPQLLGGYLSLVAEDGQAYPFPRQQTSAFLPAGGTVDAVLTPSHAGSYALLDRFMSLTNNQGTGGGSYAFLSVQAGDQAAPPSQEQVRSAPAAPAQEPAGSTLQVAQKDLGGDGTAGCSAAGGGTDLPVLLLGVLGLLRFRRPRR